MFGVLKPALSHVSADCKELYNLTYCNLCAALSASGAGVWNRLFLVNDVVTLDWLISGAEKSTDHAFSCYNCTKGGTLGRKNKISEHQQFLAAVSSYACGVKVNDNAIDSPKLKNKSLALVYRPIMKKAEATLEKLNLLDKLVSYQKQDRVNELEKGGDLSLACEPTEKSYQLILKENAKYNSNFPAEILSSLGKYFGRCVYLLDAIADMDSDRKKNQYNVLNLMMSANHKKQDVVGLCLDFLKPLRHEIADKILNLQDRFKYNTVEQRCESLFLSIEKQLYKLIKPLGSHDLLTSLSSFSVFNNSCQKSSSWSAIQVCCCPCCPCCSCCPCCC
ncbi:MAG: DUF5685 family protein [Legionellaceae bacterium]|nr:DUF5685 family protein [Legionellaceae bacterium]